jgi:hypothetical protein
MVMRFQSSFRLATSAGPYLAHIEPKRHPRHPVSVVWTEKFRVDGLNRPG